MLYNPINKLIVWVMKRRFAEVKHGFTNPEEVQLRTLMNLVKTAEKTEWGKLFDFAHIKSYEDFARKVPVQNYSTLKPYIDRIRGGEQTLLWPTHIKWFAKSSGTTSGRSKFIPVSQEAIDKCHFKGGRDLLSIYFSQRPDSNMFEGYSLRLGGSTTFNSKNHETYFGDLSAILIENLPYWTEVRCTPNQSTALMEEWESKLEKIVDEAIKKNVTSLIGGPSWMLVLIKKVLERTGAKDLSEVWPNLELYGHGGVSFAPYEKQFKKLLPDSVTYLETYNASEGFFGIQDRINEPGLALLVDQGIFYEFIPYTPDGRRAGNPIPLSHVQEGVDYAVVISTNAGLWRYEIGDTVRFNSTAPYRFEISGRTQHFINAFGEELIIDNAEKALKNTCDSLGVEILEYTAAPIYMDERAKGAHEWVIEFSEPPKDMQYFRDILDSELKKVNSDYEAKRHRDSALQPPIIHQAKNQLFYEWLKQNGKLGGQHKIPRLSNQRKHIDELLKLNK
jgi:hypothetical protein